MADWTSERVLGLAPDAASLGPARELASPAKWVTCGADEVSAWGEAKGSGAKPYQVAVDLRGPAFKCSCPSRKIPCKHTLGLLLRVAAGQAPSASAPDWVRDWLDKRTEKQVEKAATPRAEADPEAAAKRADQRWRKILSGLDECEAFLIDVAGQGLLSAQSARSWDQMAARAVDAQAPGMARRLKRVGSRIGIGHDWSLEAAAGMGNMALLIEAARRSESLDDAMRADVGTALGIPVRKGDLSGERLADMWDVLGQAVEQEDRVTTYRTWLRGRASERWAMHLSFSVAGQAPELRLTPGTALVAELEFYPSAWPLRAQVGEISMVRFEPGPGTDWEAVLNQMSLALAACPWLEQVPAGLANARLGRTEAGWWTIDATGAAVGLRGCEPWDVLAQSGNDPCNLFGEFNGLEFRPLSAWGSWGYSAL